MVSHYSYILTFIVVVKEYHPFLLVYNLLPLVTDYITVLNIIVTYDP